MLMKKRAVGEIMGAIILILIAGVAGSIFYNISLRSMNEQTANAREEIIRDSSTAKERLFTTYASFDPLIIGTSEIFSITLWTMNYGQSEIKIENIYVSYDVSHLLSDDDPFTETILYQFSEDFIMEAYESTSDDYDDNSLIYTGDIKRIFIENAIMYEDILLEAPYLQIHGLLN